MLSDDLLPQPYRLVNKILQDICSQALDEIGHRLQRGCVVDKKFAPPKTLRQVPVSVCEVLSVAEQQASNSLRHADADGIEGSEHTVAPHVTAVHLGEDTVHGFSNGAIKIVACSSSDEGDVELISPSLVDSSVVSIDGVRPLHTEPVFAVAAANSVVVVTVDVRDDTPPPAPYPLGDKYKGLNCREIAAIQPDDVEKKTITSVKLSLDGETLAVGVDGNTSIYVFQLPKVTAVSSPALGTTTTTTEGNATKKAQLVLVATAPPPPIPEASSTNNSSSASCTGSVFDFFCAPQDSTMLGYYHEARHCRPQRALSLFVCWLGTFTISRFPVQEYYTNAKQRVQDAKNVIAASQQAALSSQAAQAAAAAAAAGGGGGKGKGGKGAAAAAAAPAGSPSSTGPASGDASYASLVPELFYSGRRDTVLQRLLVTATFNSSRSLCAVGCLDGVIVVHDALCIVHVFTAAAHRLSQPTINTMYPVSMTFLPSVPRLVVGFHVQNISNRCFVDVYDLTSSRVSSPQSSASVAAAATGAGDGSAASQKKSQGESSSSLPRGCVSRRRYVSQLRAVLPLCSLPLYFMWVQEGVFVVDATSADVLGQVTFDGEGAPLAAVLNDVGGDMLLASFGGAVRHAQQSQIRVRLLGDDSILLLASNHSVYRFFPVTTFAALYPSLGAIIGGGGPPGMLEAVYKLFNSTHHSMRDSNTQKLLGGGPSDPLVPKAATSKSVTSDAQRSRATSQKGGSSATPAAATTTNVDSGKNSQQQQGRTLSTTTSPTGPLTLANTAGPSSGSNNRGSGSWERVIRRHIDEREDSQHLRQQRMKGFWEAMKQR